MAALTVGEIFTRVQRQFGDDTSAQLTIDDVVRWINDAMRDIAINNDLLQVRGTQNSVANQKNYTLPTDIMKLQSVKYAGISLRASTLQELDSLMGTDDQTIAQGYAVGTPQTYWLYANELNLYPAPATSLAGGISIYYTRQPTDVAASTDVPGIPQEYHNSLVEYCMAKAFELDANHFVASMKQQRFDQSVAALKQNVDWNSQQYYPFITGIDESSGDYW